MWSSCILWKWQYYYVLVRMGLFAAITSIPRSYSSNFITANFSCILHVHLKKAKVSATVSLSSFRVPAGEAAALWTWLLPGKERTLWRIHSSNSVLGMKGTPCHCHIIGQNWTHDLISLGRAESTVLPCLGREAGQECSTTACGPPPMIGFIAFWSWDCREHQMG